MPTSRRDILAFGAGSLAISVLARVPGAGATPQEAVALIEKFTGGIAHEPGNIALDLPEIAENGTTVSMTVAVESPMTADDYVSDILVVAESNPRPGIATFHLTPMSGKAEVAARIRLATTENVIVVAKTNKGRFLSRQMTVKVTVGGCGG